MESFLLPLQKGNSVLEKFSPTGIFLASVSVGIITAVQNNLGQVIGIMLLIVVGATIARTRWRTVLSLAAKFEVLILFWMFLMPFIYGTTVLFVFELPFGTLNAYQEGLEFGLLIGFRMMTMVLLFLSALSHMTLSEFIGALRTIRVPVTILGSLLIMFRYIPLFISERRRMQDAQTLRGFHRGTRAQRIKSLGYMVGSTIDRAFDRSIAVYESMTLRGFGKGMVIRAAGFRRNDILLLFLVVVLLLLIYTPLLNIVMVILQ